MAYSGTVSQTTFDTRKVIDHAFRRCRIPPQLISAEYIDTAKDSLYLLLSELSAQGMPSWTNQKSIYPLYDGVGFITTFAGTIDIMSANLRTTTEVTGDNTDSATQRVIDFTDDTIVTTVGVYWSATAAPLEFARSDDNVTWTVIQLETPDASAGEWSWYDMDQALASRYFRVRATSGTLDFDTLYTGNSPNEIPMGRINIDNYTTLPDKSFTSDRPLQYWLDRQAASPVMRIWPVPNDAATTSQVVVWAQRHIMDVGTMTQEIEVPQRWYDAIVWSLADRLAAEIIEVDPAMMGPVNARATAALQIAWQSNGDDSPFMLSPDISAYTA